MVLGELFEDGEAPLRRRSVDPGDVFGRGFLGKPGVQDFFFCAFALGEDFGDDRVVPLGCLANRVAVLKRQEPRKNPLRSASGSKAVANTRVWVQYGSKTFG